MSVHNSIDTRVSNQEHSNSFFQTLLNIKHDIELQRKNAKLFKQNAIKVYGNKYGYRRVKFYSELDMVEIVCPKHGAFKQTPHKHLKGFGCSKCNDSPVTTSKREYFSKQCDYGTGMSYVILCVGDNEKFYKIGITSKNSVKKRFHSKEKLPYEYSVLFEIKNDSDAIIELEKILHKLLNDYSYFPKKYFGGRTECFSTIEPILFLLEKIRLNTID